MAKVLILDLGAEVTLLSGVVERIIDLARKKFQLGDDDKVIVDNDGRLLAVMSEPSEAAKFLKTYELTEEAELHYVRVGLTYFAAPVSLLDSLAASLMRDVCGTCPDKDDCPLCRECPQKDTCSEYTPPGH